jgi:glutathione S-transferase
MPATPLELLQFPYSHYNEKARWALDLKQAPHTRTSYLPGPHMISIRRLTGGTEVPVMRFGTEIVAGSARIVEELERRFPNPPLYPRDPVQRARALEIQAWFDDAVGPMVRRAVFDALLTDGGYVCSLFASDRNTITRTLYRAAFPATKLAMKASMGIAGAASIVEACARVQEALDFVARESGSPEGQLVGDAFTIADLAAASLLAPAVSPPHSPMALPEPHPAALRAWLARWADHPGAAWVRAQFRKHRPASAESTGTAALRRSA